MSVQRRPKTGRPKGGGKPKWIVRYRSPSGREHSKTFPTRAEAVAYDEEQSRLLRRREWVDDSHAPPSPNCGPSGRRPRQAPGRRRCGSPSART